MCRPSARYPVNPASRSVAHTASTRLAVLAAILVALGIFSIARIVMKPKPDDPLQGGSEDAIVGLTAKLQRMPADKHGRYLLDALRNAAPGLRYAAVDELVRANPRGTADALERAFQDSSSLVRQRAMETLPDIDAARGKRLLLAGLFDEDSWVRDAAVAQLSHSHSGLANKSDVSILIRALDDTDSTVVTSSANLLNKLTGRPWRIRNAMTDAQRSDMVAHWKAWWRDTRDPAYPRDKHVTPIYPTRADPAPDFAIQDIDGDTISLAGLRGRITLLNFWGTWCGPCQAEIPGLVRIDAAYRDKRVDVIGIALGESSADSLREWCVRHGVKYRQAMADDAIKADYGHIDEVPVSILIDRKGRIRYRWEAERDFDTYKATLNHLLQERG